MQSKTVKVSKYTLTNRNTSAHSAIEHYNTKVGIGITLTCDGVPAAKRTRGAVALSGHRHE